MGSLDLLERKEPWGLLESGPGVQRGRKVHQVVLGSRVHVGPVDLLAPVVLVEIQAIPVLLDPLVYQVVLAGREIALKESKETVDPQEDEELKAPGATRVLLVPQVLVSKERKETKEQQVIQDPLDPQENLDNRAGRVNLDYRVCLDRKARWGTRGSQDL